MESFVMSSHGNDLKLKSRLRMAASNILKRARGRPPVNRNNNNNCNNAHKQNRNHQNKNNYYLLRNCNHHANNTASNNNIEDGNDPGSTSSNDARSLCKGPFTREVYNAICGRLGETLNIPEDAILPLFHDMQLYPSKQQVTDMLQCARQCGRRNGTTYLTFAEFCLFAREMQAVNRLARNTLRPKKCTNNCEVFLGGSCNPTTWRIDTAIPELQKHGITYYNPQVSMWAPELVAAEHNAKESASVLLYVVDSQTRSVSGMIEVAYLVASGRCVVLVAYPYSLGQSIMGEIITKRECYDLVSGQTTLLALVKSQGIKVHSNLTSAIQCTTKLLRNPCVNKGMTTEEQITYKLRKLRETFDYYDQDRTGEISLMDVVSAYSRLTNRNIEPLQVYNYLNSTDVDSNVKNFTFQHFCALVAEFSVDGCENFNNAWVSQPLQCTRYQNDNEINIDRHLNNSLQSWDIFLGGSCRPHSCRWRDLAISLVKKHGLTYYNPTVRNLDQNYTNGNVQRTTFYYESEQLLNESTVLQWRRAIDRSKVLLFVVSNDTRSLTTMIMAAYYIGLNREVILCVQHLLEDESEVGNEKLSKQAIKDYNRGRVYLTDLAKRKHVAVFENVTKAVLCAIEKCQR